MIVAANELACDAFHIQINVRLDSGCWFDLSKLNAQQDIMKKLMPNIACLNIHILLTLAI